MLTELNYKGYEEYLVKESDNYFGSDSFLYEFEFNHGYKAVVMKHLGTLGGSNDLFELVIYHNYNMMSESPVGTGIKGYLSNEQVLEVLDKLKEL